MKNFLSILFCLFIIPTFAQAELKEILITPATIITTSNDEVSEGDFVEFKVIGTEKKLRGLIVKYQENGFAGKEAILVVDQFEALNSNDKYTGTISISGNQHNNIMEFLTYFAMYVRGGEVTIIPNRDIFSLWSEE